MALRFASTAFRHRTSSDQSAYVVEHCGMPLDEPQEDGNDLVLYLGDDWRGALLEVMGIELESGDLLVIHAMPLRDKYGDDYARVIPWQRP